MQANSVGSGLTPLVNSMPCMRITAMADAHTMAAELDRPPPVVQMRTQCAEGVAAGQASGGREVDAARA